MAIEEVFEGGEARKLGTLEQPESALTMAWPTFPGPDGSPNPIPKPEWKESENSLFGVLRVSDQDGVGECAAAATAGAIEDSRLMAGLEQVELSAGDLYRRVCGGRDQGSLPEDNLKELMANGILPEAMCPFTDWKRNYDSTGETRGLYRGTEAWLLPTVEHIFTAVMMGFPVVGGYWHYNSDPTDSEGWMTKPGGRRGGHSVRFRDVVKRNGTWGLRFPNNWTVRWGVNGFGILPETRIAEGLQSFAFWALRAVTFTKVNLPPLRG